MRAFAWLCGASITVASVSHPCAAQEFPDVRLPPHVRIAPPGATVSPELASFVGAWKGRWGGRLASILVVERVSPTGAASVIYAWGANPSLNIRPGSSEHPGMVRDRTLTFGDDPRFEFSRTVDGSLVGKRIFKGVQDGYVTMSKMTLSQADIMQGQPSRSSCELDAPPFAIGDATRMQGRDLMRAIAGKRLVAIRKYATISGYTRGVRELRPDGSFVFTCENGPSATGPWTACRRVGVPGFVMQGNRDVGTWSAAANQLCLQSTRANFQVCVSVHRSGAQLYAQRTSGTPSCLEGPVAIE